MLDVCFITFQMQITEKTGYNNWKFVFERFEKHLFLSHHKDSTFKYDIFIDIIGGQLLPIDKLIDKDSRNKS